jgi:ATP-dependent Clp protease ATP-binding subunit ClpB
MGSDTILENFEDLANVGEEHRQEIIQTTKEEVFQTLRENLRPEFLNRIDERIMFTPLTRAEIKQIARLLLRRTEKMLARQGMIMKISDRALAWLAERGYDPQFGARPMKRVLQADLADKLSKDLISGKFAAGDTIYTDVGNDVLVFSKEPFPVEPAAESSPEDKAEAQAVAQEKAGEQAGGKRTRRSKKGAGPQVPSNGSDDAGGEEPEGTVAELKKATQDLLDATRSQGEGPLGEV